MTAAITRDPIYRRRRSPAEVIELCVRWYITYRLSYRDLVAMTAAYCSMPTRPSVDGCAATRQNTERSSTL
jgi:hypothetical protein